MTPTQKWLAENPVGVPPRPTANNCDEGTNLRRNLFGELIQPTAALPEAEPPPLHIVPKNQLRLDLNDPAHLDGTGQPPSIYDVTSLPSRGIYPGCDSVTDRPVVGVPWQVAQPTIPGSDSGDVFHPAARPR